MPLKKRIVFITFDGKQYSDSPKYISDYLLENKPEIKQIWLVNEPSSFKKDGIKFVKYHTIKSIFVIWTSRCIVTNNGTPTFMPYRRKQIILDTWHGGGAGKVVGLLRNQVSNYDRYFFKYHAKKTTAFISSSEFLNDKLFRQSFGYNGEILSIGLPRNSYLFAYTKDDVNTIKEKLNISKNCKVVLYAPTFRISNDNLSQQLIDPDRVLEACKNRFKNEFVFLYRCHHMSSFHFDSSKCIDVSKYPDMQELLALCDVLISDYSSCLWDASIIHKKCIMFAPDVDEFQKNVNMYLPIDQWPYPVSTNNDELYEIITKFNELDYNKQIDNYLSIMKSFDSKESTKLASKWICDKINI